MAEYAVRGSKIYCDKCAGRTTYLEVPLSHGVEKGGQPAAAAKDCVPFVNVHPFGECMSPGYEAAKQAFLARHPEKAYLFAGKGGHPCFVDLLPRWFDNDDSSKIASFEETGAMMAATGKVVLGPEYSSVTTNSWNVCRAGGNIRFASGGQTPTTKMSPAIYPQKPPPLVPNEIDKKLYDLVQKAKKDSFDMTWNGLSKSDLLINLNKYVVEAHQLEKEILPLPYIQKWQLEILGWMKDQGASERDIQDDVRLDDVVVLKLNSMLKKYDITSPFEISHLISQCSVESAYGSKLNEILDSTPKSYTEETSGAGYLQFTGKDNYLRLASILNDQEIVKQGSHYVAEVYPWTSAGVWWTDEKMGNMKSWFKKYPDITVLQVSRQVNLGNINSSKTPLGLEERELNFDKCKIVIGESHNAT